MTRGEQHPPRLTFAGSPESWMVGVRSALTAIGWNVSDALATDGDFVSQVIATQPDIVVLSGPWATPSRGTQFLSSWVLRRPRTKVVVAVDAGEPLAVWRARGAVDVVVRDLEPELIADKLLGLWEAAPKAERLSKNPPVSFDHTPFEPIPLDPEPMRSPAPFLGDPYEVSQGTEVTAPDWSSEPPTRRQPETDLDHFREMAASRGLDVKRPITYPPTDAKQMVMPAPRAELPKADVVKTEISKPEIKPETKRLAVPKPGGRPPTGEISLGTDPGTTRNVVAKPIAAAPQPIQAQAVPAPPETNIVAPQRDSQPAERPSRPSVPPPRISAPRADLSGPFSTSSRGEIKAPRADGNRTSSIPPVPPRTSVPPPMPQLDEPLDGASVESDLTNLSTSVRPQVLSVVTGSIAPAPVATLTTDESVLGLITKPLTEGESSEPIAPPRLGQVASGSSVAVDAASSQAASGHIVPGFDVSADLLNRTTVPPVVMGGSGPFLSPSYSQLVSAAVEPPPTRSVPFGAPLGDSQGSAFGSSVGGSGFAPTAVAAPSSFAPASFSAPSLSAPSAPSFSAPSFSPPSLSLQSAPPSFSPPPSPPPASTRPKWIRPLIIGVGGTALVLGGAFVGQIIVESLTADAPAAATGIAPTASSNGSTSVGAQVAQGNSEAPNTAATEAAGAPKGASAAEQTPPTSAIGSAPPEAPVGVTPSTTAPSTTAPSTMGSNPAPAATSPDETRIASIRDSGRRADEFVSLGERLEREGQHAEASRIFARANEADGNNPHAAAGLSRTALAQRDGAQALSWAERAVQLRRRRGEYYILLGDAQAALGNRAAAVEAWRRAVSLGETSARSRLSGD